MFAHLLSGAWRRRAVILAAAVILGAIWAWKPACVAWHLSRGQRALDWLGDPEAALKQFEAALRIDPAHGKAHFLLARAHRRLGHAQEVYDHILLARQASFPEERLRREWILALAQAGRMDLAEPHVLELLTKPGDDGPEICAAFVAGYVHNFEYHQAFRYLEAWQKDYPQDPEPRIMRGKVRRRFQNYREAEREFRAAYALRPQYKDARELLAGVLVEQSKYDEAVKLLEQALAESPNDQRLLLGWAECLVQLGRYQEARGVFEKVLAQTPENCQALLGMGRVDLWDDRVASAVERLEKARALCPGRTDVRYALAQALSRAGERERAQRELAALEEARAAITRAFDLAEELIARPNDAARRFEIGTLLMEYGDAAEGAAWLETIFQFEPEHAEAHRALARYYLGRGDQERAAAHQKALHAADQTTAAGTEAQ
jgi:tetratricopeptide (TPR) repeat protein